jgi:hypothetical protein
MQEAITNFSAQMGGEMAPLRKMLRRESILASQPSSSMNGIAQVFSHPEHRGAGIYKEALRTVLDF